MRIPFHIFNKYAFLICVSFFVLKEAKCQQAITLEYIEKFANTAMYEMKTNNIPASITLAQGILESSNGKSRLSMECNNHFGIKCKKNWTGSFCNEDDDAAQECFRGYANATESYKDHSLFLTENQRYSGLFQLGITDYVGWAYGLRDAGYATNPAYPSLLIGLIERFNLGKYDTLVFKGAEISNLEVNTNKEIFNNGVPLTYAKEGETAEIIAQKQDMGYWQIYKYNDLSKADDIEPGEIVYLKPKRKKAEHFEHIYTNGETMRGISQHYGIKLKCIYKMNRMHANEIPVAGEKVFLQTKRPKENPIKVIELTNTDENEVKQKPNGIIKSETEWHTILAGQTLYSIAKAYKISVEDIKLWNGIKSESLKPGSLLRIKKPILKVENTESVSLKHIVKSGETLYGIAKKYGVSVSDLMAWNTILNATLTIGQELIVKP